MISLSLPPTSAELPRAAGPTLGAFLDLLFCSLETYHVTYCILHGYEELPSLPSDLDMAVHPGDLAALEAALLHVSESGYELVQRFTYAAGANYYIFAWFEKQKLRLVAVDVITEHRRGGLILANAQELVANRRRHGDFWIANSCVQFSYLLA